MVRPIRERQTYQERRAGCWERLVQNYRERTPEGWTACSMHRATLSDLPVLFWWMTMLALARANHSAHSLARFAALACQSHATGQYPGFVRYGRSRSLRSQDLFHPTYATGRTSSSPLPPMYMPVHTDREPPNPGNRPAYWCSYQRIWRSQVCQNFHHAGVASRCCWHLLTY